MRKNVKVFKNKATTGRNNICGEKIYVLRKKYIPKMSQRILAEKCQLLGLDIDKNAIQRIECGKRFITDIELRCFASIFGVSVSELFASDLEGNFSDGKY